MWNLRLHPIQASNAVTAKWIAMSWWDSRAPIQTTQESARIGEILRGESRSTRRVVEICWKYEFWNPAKFKSLRNIYIYLPATLVSVFWKAENFQSFCACSQSPGESSQVVPSVHCREAGLEDGFSSPQRFTSGKGMDMGFHHRIYGNTWGFMMFDGSWLTFKMWIHMGIIERYW